MDLRQTVEDLRDPASMTYLRVLSKATAAASAITVASTALQKRFGGTLVPHGCLTGQFDPAVIHREDARQRLGFSRPVVFFPGTPRTPKGLKPMADART